VSAPVLHVYVAAPFDRAATVRHFHAMLLAVGARPVSQWANLAKGPEQLEAMSRGEIRSLIEVNDACVRQADLLVCLACKGKGGETFAEVARAIEWGKPVLYCGPPILSAFRPGVFLCTTQKDVLDVVSFLASEGRPVDEALAVYFGAAQVRDALVRVQHGAA